MARKELDEIKGYWDKKYPNIYVSLYSNQDGNKYFGRMMGTMDTVSLSADTIGDLISQGEAFLRTLK